MTEFEDYVKVFVSEMLRVKREWQLTKGDSWKTCSIGFLRKELKRQIEQLDESEEYGLKVSKAAMHELIDLGNLAVMLWARLNMEDAEVSK